MFNREVDIDHHVKPLSLLSHLKRRDVVTGTEYDSISQGTITDHQRIILIIDAIVSKGRNAFDEFIAALKEEQQHPPHQELAQLLEEELAGSHHSHPVLPSLVDDVISLHLPYLENSLNPDVLIPYLVRHQLVTTEEQDHLSNPTFTRAARNRYIFSRLYRCGSDAVERFIKCLIEEKSHPPHHNLAERLIEQLSQLEEHRELADRLEQALHDTRAEAQHPQ